MRDFESGALVGRAFVVAGCGACDVRSVAQSAQSTGDDEDRFSFCRDVAPNDGDLADCAHELAYRSRGPSLLWVRRDTRVPTRAAVDAKLAEICGGVPVGAMRGPDRESARERARRAAILETSPKTKIIPILLHQELAWIGSRQVYGPLARLLELTFGWSSSSRMFPYGEAGFQAVSLAAVHTVLSGGSMESGFSVDGVSADVGRGKIRGKLVQDGQLVSIGPAMKVALVESDVTFADIILSVPFRGGRARVSLDQDGPYRVEVPISQGGIPSDRVIRRIADARKISSDAVQSLQASCDAVG